MNKAPKNKYQKEKPRESWWMEPDFYKTLRREELRISQQPLWYNPSTNVQVRNPLTKRVK